MIESTHDKSISQILEQIILTCDKIKSLNANYSDGSGPRLSIEKEIDANQAMLETLCKTLVDLNKITRI